MRQSKVTGSKNRILAGLLTTLVAFTGLTALNVTMATPSHAEIIGVEDSSGGGGTGVGGGGGTSVPGAGNPGGNPGGGGGGWVPVDRYAPYWVTTWGGTSLCANRIGVGHAIGVSQMWQIQTSMTPSKDTRPAGEGWVDTGTYITGYGQVWERTILTGNLQCHYPPRYELVPQQCTLSTTATITQKRPSVVSLGTKTSMSGYTLGNPSPEACKNSKSAAAVDVDINRYSLVEAVAVSKVVNQTFKVYVEVDPRTGVIPAPELQAQGVPFNLTPKTASLSITCKGVSKPADYSVSDFTDNYCNPSKGGGSTYQCNVSPVQFKVAMGTSETETWNSFPNNSIQYATTMVGNPGQNIKFNQSVTGAGITVDSYKTAYKSNLPYTELDIVNASGTIANKNVLTGTKQDSAQFAGQKPEVNLVFNGATEQGNNMKLTQIQQWTGTRLVSMPVIRSVDPVTGDINLDYIQKHVPTSGKCEQSADITVLRAIGDSIS